MPDSNYLKQKIRPIIINLAKKILNSNELRSNALVINREFQWPDYQALEGIKNQPTEYEDLKKEKTNDVNLRDDIVFVTGRFRSGSTVFWNIFRQLEDFTAYYEPFNERRWFDSSSRGQFVDRSHKGVKNYWAEFEGLDHLSQYFQDEWIEKKLYMDENSFDPNMFKYINGMIEAAKGRPLMQFNRIDFRLAWIRKHYPNAKIIHIYRHPRDQYISTLLVKGSQPKDYIQSTVKNFTDHFYLKMWARALHYHFPFIKEPPEQHPYETFYFIWKLSYLYGLKHADYSVKFEELAEDPQSKLSEVFSTLNISSVLVDQAAKVVQKQPSSKWKNYGRDEWFEEIECYCEGILDHFFYSIN